MLKARRINYVNEKRHKKSDHQIATCPRRELNPHRPCGPQDFKSCVSTSFTTRARKFHHLRSSQVPELEHVKLLELRNQKKSSAYTARGSKSGRPGSNRPPRPWQGRALPNELLPHDVTDYTDFILRF